VGIASIVLNVLSVVTLPMVFAVAVMTTDSPPTPKGHFRALGGFRAGHLVVVLASIAAAWRLRSQSRPGAALLSALTPAVWIALAFGFLAIFGFGGKRSPAKE